MKHLIASVAFFLQFALVNGQTPVVTNDSLVVYFKELKDATWAHRDLWNKDLYGPILLVNPANRQLFSNVRDSAGFLKPAGTIYSCILPENVNIANTSSQWNGKDWAMIKLPLPANKQERINLMAHELFHVSQPSLGFRLYNVANNHLDQKDGRIYLRLELEALKQSIQCTSSTERKKCLTDAFAFRMFRYSLYPGADSSENLMELNEGIAEYTGVIISNGTWSDAVKHFVQMIDDFMSNPTFVRSFPYVTTPVYGYLLYPARPGWNLEINIHSNLAAYFIKVFNITMPSDLKTRVETISDKYNGKMIIAEETEREANTKRIIAELKSKFLEQPHFEIRLEKMNISFDPRNIIPVEDKGSFYKNARITDVWGILTINNGALMSPGWDKISVSVPLKIDNKSVNGDGWTLELNNGYTVSKNENTGNYSLIKP